MSSIWISAFRGGRIHRIDVALRVIAALAVFAVAAPPSSAQQPSVDEIVIAAGLGSDSETGDGWFFIVEVSGENLTSASVIPPTGGPILLEDESGFGETFEAESGPFASLSALQMVHPPGSYTFTVEGSETVTLSWNPIEPVGSLGEPTLVIDSPADGSANVSTMPDVAYTLDCTNCTAMNMEMENLFGISGSFGFGQLAPPFLNPIPFSIMENESGATELDLGQAEVEMLSGLVTFSDETFDQPTSLGSFEYIEAAVVIGASVFTVPEPMGTAAALAALATLALLRARRPR